MNLKQILAKKTVLILLTIFILASFLRIYNLGNWLRFNDDQVRDAIIIDKMISAEAFPLLGPKAGGTQFNLGPAFYYMEYASASIFGNSPINLAYPIILFFLLSIPLFFYVSKLIFGENIALLTTFLYSISAFGIKYSRFAWNPNIIPFFVLLLLISFYKLYDPSLTKKSRLLWSLIAGITLGISIQLHTTLFFILPVFCLSILSYSFFKKRFHIQSFLIILFLTLLLNTPQMVYDIRFGGENAAAFFQGFTEKTTAQTHITSKLKNAAICSVQGHLAILSGITMSDDCDLLSKNNRKSSLFWPMLASASIFFFGGVFLFLKNFIQQKDDSKKYLLGIIALFSVLFLFLLVPLGKEVSQRFFITLFFLPFILFGFWINFFMKINKLWGYITISAIIIVIIFSHAMQFQKMYLHGDGGKYFGGNKLGDIRPVADYIARDIKNDSSLYTNYFMTSFRAMRPTGYLLEKMNIDNIQYNASLKDVRENMSLANSAIYVVDDMSSGKNKGKTYFSGFQVLEQKNMGKYTVIKLTPTK